MLHQIVHYLEIAAILTCLAALIGYVAWHGERQGKCKKAGRPTSSSTGA